VAILLGGRLLGVHRVEHGAPDDAIRLRAPADASPRITAILEAMPEIAQFVEAPDRDGTVLWRLVADDPAAASRLADRLRAAGIATVETREAMSGLESLFLRLTADEARA
jgi:hypothetical protein